MIISLLDYKVKGLNFNREQTGTFGSQMRASGFLGSLITNAKKDKLHLPIMSFAYMATLLKNAGHDVGFFHDDGDIPKNTQLVFIASSMAGYKIECGIAAKIRKNSPQAKIGFIGAFASVKPELFKEASDFIIDGEPEGAILEFIQGNKALEGIVHSPQVPNLDDLPVPDWDIMGVDNFSYFPILPKKPFLPVITSRGCTFNCDFCPYMVSQKPAMRYRAVNSVLNEIETLIKKYKIKNLLFRDITFTMNKKRIQELCQGMIDRKFNLDWACETRVDLLDPELIQLMYKSGLRGVNLGIESFNLDIMKKNGKKPDSLIHQNNIIELMNKLGIKVSAFYMLGFPDETEADIQNTIDYSQSLNTHFAQFCIFTPFPGTPTFEEMKGRLLTEDWTKFTEYYPVIKYEKITPQKVEQLRDKAFVSYYFRPRWIARYGVNTLRSFFN
ncbi:MAG: hypothetical protein A2901_01435 [Elusimicrobia bacterium RIFCSPLOWO2_01_FULL_54_10]|nr:MAG: hypothetical protein A2901_01435 [Elusimicrobia bacterium RIFCSPLOWO2_01_FULL_54_10]